MNHFAVHLKLTQYCKSTILELKKKKTTTFVLEGLFLFHGMQSSGTITQGSCSPPDQGQG